MHSSRAKTFLSPASLCVLVVTLLSVGIGRPVQAQGFLEKVQETTRSIREEIQDKGEKADTAMSKAGQTADAVKCLAGDADCSEPAEAQAYPPAAADSSGPAFGAPVGTGTALPQCESRPGSPAGDDA